MRPPADKGTAPAATAVDVVRIARALDAELGVLLGAWSATAQRDAAVMLLWTAVFAGEAWSRTAIAAARGLLDDGPATLTGEAKTLVAGAVLACEPADGSAMGLLARTLLAEGPKTRRAAVDAWGLVAPMVAPSDELAASVYGLLREATDEGPWALVACLCAPLDDEARFALYDGARRHVPRLETRAPLSELAVGWPAANTRWLPIAFEGAAATLARVAAVLPTRPGQLELPVGGSVLDTTSASRAARRAIYRDESVPRLRLDAWRKRMREHPLTRPLLDRVTVPSDLPADDVTVH